MQSSPSTTTACMSCGGMPISFCNLCNAGSTLQSAAPFFMRRVAMTTAPKLISICAIAAIGYVAMSLDVVAQGFPTQCLASKKAASGKARKVDNLCGLPGLTEADPNPEPHRAQNRAKNNFCASGTPIDLSRDDF